MTDRKGCSTGVFQPELLHWSSHSVWKYTKKSHFHLPIFWEYEFCAPENQVENALIQYQRWDIFQIFKHCLYCLTANHNKKCISMFWLAKKCVQLFWYTNEFPRSLRSVVSMDYSSYDPHKMSLQWPVESFNKTTNVTEKRRKKKF